MGTRRKGREAALQLLYGLEFHSEDSARSVDIFWRIYNTNQEIRTFGGTLADGVIAHMDAINELLSATSKRWKIERMAAIDRNILRIAVFELKYLSEIPMKVSINEAIEIAKKYGTSDSPAFVNGILDKIASTHEE